MAVNPAYSALVVSGGQGSTASGTGAVSRSYAADGPPNPDREFATIDFDRRAVKNLLTTSATAVIPVVGNGP